MSLDEANANETLFRQQVEQYLLPHKGKFNYEVMLQGHLDISRFFPWVDQVRQFKNLEQQVVLCSGCGSAGDLYCFLKSGARFAVGMEVDKNLVRLARARIKSSSFSDRSLVSLYNGEVLPFKNESFDIAFSMHVIEHVKSFHLYLSEMLRILKRGGILFLELPNRYFPIEQHSSIPFIHYLPMLRSGKLIRFMSKGLIGKILTKDFRCKVGILEGAYIPWPHTLLRTVEKQRKNCDLTIIQAAFHSHSDQISVFNWKMFPWALTNWGRKTTFRLVLKKN